MVVNDSAGYLIPLGARATIVSKLAPTGTVFCLRVFLALNVYGFGIHCQRIFPRQPLIFADRL